MMELNNSMIIGLKFRNFKSYRDEAEFSFHGLSNDALPGNYTDVKLADGTNERVLHTAVVLGANASGKSNVVQAFHALNYMVRNSRDFGRGNDIDAYEPFAFDERTEDSPVEIEVEVTTGSGRFIYEIAYNRTAVTKEVLYIREGERQEPVFQREENAEGLFHHFSFGSGWHHPIPDWVSMELMGNHLLLSEISSKQAYELNDVYDVLAYINAFVSRVNMKTINDNIAPLIIKSSKSELYKRLVRMIQVADLGIQNMRMIRHSDEEFHIPDFVSEEQRRRMIEENRWEFQMLHKYIDKDRRESGRSWDLRKESAGTRSLLGVGAVILGVLEMGSLLVYDELNIALHPEITRLLINLFQDPEANPNHAQLLFTTHDASLIGESLLRADQVWIAEKDNDGCSHLYSIQDFEEVPIIPPMEQWYRAGRFGGLPKINNVHYIFSGEVTE